MSVPVTMTLSGKQLTVSVAASKGPGAAHGEVWICAMSRAVPITISRGENRGREVTYHNVVRSLLKVGDWNGSSGSWTVPLEDISRDGVDAAVAYVQDGSKRQAGPDAGGGSHAAALKQAKFIPGHAACCAAAIGISRRQWRASPKEDLPQKEKGPTFVGPVSGIYIPCVRPDPDGPGGLGAEESGTERTGPTQ